MRCSEITLLVFLALLLAASLLAGCVADRALSPGERHKAWVCLHTSEVRFALTTARLVAEKIKDPRARASAHEAVDREEAVLESCALPAR